MGSFKIEIDDKTRKDIQALLNSGGELYNNSGFRALKKVVVKVKSDESDAVREEYNLAKKYVDQKITTRLGTEKELKMSVKAADKPIGLANFEYTRPHVLGVSVWVKKSEPRKIIYGAFMEATATKSGIGNLHVFQREYRKTGRPGKKFLRGQIHEVAWPKFGRKFTHPVNRLTGPRITDLLSKDGVLGPLLVKAGQHLTSEIDVELARSLSQI